MSDKDILVCCDRCGWEGLVCNYYIWQGDRRYPNVWICDVCRQDLQ